MINNFSGEHFFLSNFYEHPFMYNGRTWKTVEHAFQAAKCLNQADFEAAYRAATPGEAKRIGRRATLIPNWDQKRIDVMRECLQMKFLTDDKLLQKLLDTGDKILVEGTTWHDNEWGDCSCPKCANIPGKNMLGKMLMDLRDNAREGNYLWVARDINKDNQIIMHFKNRESAFKWLNGLTDYSPNNLYYGYRLDVVKLV